MRSNTSYELRVRARTSMPAPRLARAPRGRSRGSSGAAMLEALIALPILLLLAGALAFISALYAAQQAAHADARRCALQYAARGCGGELPAGCDGILGDAQRADPDDAAKTILHATRAASGSGAFQVLDRVPVLGDAIEALFGTTVTASARRSVAGPSAGAEPQVVSAGMTLLCNARPIDVLEAAERSLCGAVLDRLRLGALCP